jgi:hypothetical protein
MTLVFAASATATEASSGWTAMKHCASIADDTARHTCTDDVLRKAGLLGVAAAQAEPPNAHKDFGLPPAPAPKPSPSDARLEVTLANVTQAGDGKLVLTTTDGAIWRQVESEAIRPMPAQGQTMVIARKSLGGFMCESAQRVAFRCYRTR